MGLKAFAAFVSVSHPHLLMSIKGREERRGSLVISTGDDEGERYCIMRQQLASLRKGLLGIRHD